MKKVPLNDITILVIEDEVALSCALRDKFMRNGFAVLEAKNGKIGLEIALREHPDLILLDIIMPVMDGMAVLHQLRKDSWGRNAQVILLTNLSEVGKVAESLSHGVHDYLVKSDWTLKDIVNKVREKLGIDV